MNVYVIAQSYELGYGVEIDTYPIVFKEKQDAQKKLQELFKEDLKMDEFDVNEEYLEIDQDDNSYNIYNNNSSNWSKATIRTLKL